MTAAQSLAAFRRVERFRPFSGEHGNGARVVVVRRGKCLVDKASGAPLLFAGAARDTNGPAVFLGLDDDERALYLLEVARDAEDAGVFARFGVVPESAEFADPMTQLGRLAHPRRELLVTALALSRWSAEHRFCNACGAALRWDEDAWTKTCVRPERPHRAFPRLDPATIMLVHDGERALLGRQTNWPDGMYSTLAGFVAPGESVEAAVVREVHEEAGIRVDDVRYFGSEPWPFPRSLMLGFFARARDFDIRIGDELADARWFTRPELRELQGRLAARLPFFDTIARRLIVAWLERESDAVGVLDS